jgi:hypothetical protein
MATNRLPAKSDQLLTLASDMTTGLKAQEREVGFKHASEANLRAMLDEFIRARSVYNASLAENAALSNALEIADAEGKHFIGNVKAVLLNVFGKAWSPEWSQIGFSTPSLGTPKSLAARQVVLKAIADYLQSNPDRQNVPLNVTIERAAELFRSLKESREAKIRCASTIASAKAARDKAEADLRKCMNNLIKELRQLVAVDDPVWYAFGLNRPSDPARPPAPDELAVTAGAPGSIHVAWKAAPRAIRYRVYTKKDNEDGFQLTASTFDPTMTITGLAEGSDVFVQVSAANDAGESKPSVPAVIVVPTAQPTTAAG